MEPDQKATGECPGRPTCQTSRPLSDSEVLNEVSRIVLKVGECPGSSGMRFKNRSSSLPAFDPCDSYPVSGVLGLSPSDTFSNRFQAVRFSDFAAAHRESKSPTNSTFVTISSPAFGRVEEPPAEAASEGALKGLLSLGLASEACELSSA
jgi:hypothetical protein